MKYAIYLIAFVIALGMAAVAGHEADVQAADQEDAEALSSREWVGQQQCGPNATAVWEDDKTLLCLRHVDAATVARSTL